MKSFGSQEIGLSRLGTFYLTYAVVEESYRGKHLGRALLEERFKILATGFFNSYVKQSSASELQLGTQELDGKKVTKRQLLQATAPENLLVVCDLRDKQAHFGRAVAASESVGMAVTPTVEKIMQPYSQLNLKNEADYLSIQIYTGVPVNNPVKGKNRKSRRNDIQAVYVYGDPRLRAKLYQEIYQKFTQLGAQYREDMHAFFGFEAQNAWNLITELTARKEYQVLLDQPNKGEVLEGFKQKFKRSKKLHLVTIPKYDTHRFGAGFGSKSKRR